MNHRFIGSPYEGVRRMSADEFPHTLNAAWLTGSEQVEMLTVGLKHNNSAVRYYWSAVSLAALGPNARSAENALKDALTDSAPDVRVAVCEALFNIGEEQLAAKGMRDLLKHDKESIIIECINTLFAIRFKAKAGRAL